jgi:glycosyltransferase involved in cell wall biosynthesis
MNDNRAQPHITVIIPTRERADVLEKSLMTCTAQLYANLTILVSDNCSGDRTREVALSTGDSRVSYVNTGRRLSMSDNYEFGLSQVSDGWVGIIGDDDGLLPDAIARVASIAAATHLDAIRSDTCLYRWPGLLGRDFGSLTVPLRRGIEIRKSQAWLSAVMAGGALYPNLPVLYSGGFARVSKIREIRARSNRFYHSCIPDVYSAIAIASVIDEYIFSYEPFAIDGVSRHSIGTSLVNRGPGAPAMKFREEKNIPLHADIPAAEDGSVPRVHQAWIYESYLQSRFLRDSSRELSHEHQLEVVLASPSLDKIGDEWARRFAAHHVLDFEKVRQRARRKRWRLKMIEGSRRVSRMLHTHYSVGDGSVPLRDVYEASRVAGCIQQHPPGRLETVRNLAAKAWEKVTAKGHGLSIFAG